MKFRTAAGIQFLFAFVFLVYVIIFPKFGVDEALIFRSMGFVLVGFPITLHFIFTERSQIGISKDLLKGVILMGITFSALTLLVGLETQVPILFLGFFSKPIELGYYQIALLAVFPLLVLGTSIQAPMMPILSRNIREGNLLEVSRIVHYLIRYLIFFFGFILIIFLLFGLETITLLVNTSTESLMIPYYLLVFFAILYVIASVFFAVEAMEKRIQPLLRIKAIVVSFIIFGGVPFALFFGSKGIAVIVLAAAILNIVLLERSCSARYHFNWEYGRYMRFGICALIAFITCLICKVLIYQNILSIAGIIVLGLFLYLLLNIISGAMSASDLLLPLFLIFPSKSLAN
jgi:O-antigen/teichoic acid export membrane protein